MTIRSNAFTRITRMDDAELTEYIRFLEHDLHTKQDKLHRLQQDIGRHTNILEAARKEVRQRHLTES